MGTPSFGGDWNRVPITHDRTYDPKSEAATFMEGRRRHQAAQYAHQHGALRQCRITTKELRSMVDEFMRELVNNRLDELHAADVVSKELDRRHRCRVEGRASADRRGRAAAKAAVLERVKTAVASLRDLRVRHHHRRSVSVGRSITYEIGKINIGRKVRYNAGDKGPPCFAAGRRPPLSTQT